MSVASEIETLQTNLSNCYTVVRNKGGTIPATQSFNNLSTAINSISGGSAQPVIEALTVTPSTQKQTISPQLGVDGFGPVTVNAVTGSIDNNIIAGNIKKDVTILGVTGTYEGSSQTDTEILSATNETSNTILANSSVWVNSTSTNTRVYTLPSGYTYVVTIDDTTKTITSINEQGFYTFYVLPDKVITQQITDVDVVYTFSVDYTNYVGEDSSNMNYSFLPIRIWKNAQRAQYAGLYCGMQMPSNTGTNMSAAYGYSSPNSSNSFIRVSSDSPFYNIPLQKIYYRFTYKSTGQMIYEASFDGQNYIQIYTATYTGFAYLSCTLNDYYQSIQLNSPAKGCVMRLGDCKLVYGSTVLWEPYETNTISSLVDYSNITSTAVTGIAQEDIAVNNSGNVKILKQS